MQYNHTRIPIRQISASDGARNLYASFLKTLEDKLSAGVDRNLVAREAARELYTGQSALAGLTPDSRGEPWTDNLLLAGFDPRNTLLEAERYGDADPVKYARNKPLIWLWYLFDRSPLGMDLELGFALRALLARHIFKRVGKNPKFFQFVELAFGYNLEIGDDVVVHRWVNLDDRGGIVLGDRSSLSDFVNVYSHTHDVNEQILIANVPTIIEADVRVTYHATILAGSHIKRGAMIGAGALVTGKTVPEGEIWIGFPAKRVKDKDYFIDKPTGEKWNVEKLRRNK